LNAYGRTCLAQPRAGACDGLEGVWALGVPFIVFPCSCGRYFDYEGMGMVAAIADFIDRGRIKLYCLDSVDAECWYRFEVPPELRNGRHEQYDRYVTDEVVPFVRDHCRQPEVRPMTNGCSMGGYHAVNFFVNTPSCSTAPSPAAAYTAWIDIWGQDVNHDWPWWYRQMNHFLGCLYG
jgi:esterase/lipase superfamily enzyme